MSAVIEILDGALDRKFLYPVLNKFNSESGLGDSRMITSGGGRVQNASDRPYAKCSLLRWHSLLERLSQRFAIGTANGECPLSARFPCQ